MCCVYMIYLLPQDIRTVAISFECQVFLGEKLEDIQMILQLSERLSATNICEQNMCDFMFMQHKSFRQG